MEVSLYASMFFQNLKTIQKSVECMLEMDSEEVDKLLHDHDWASDHISSSQDDIEEVCNFLCNMLGKNQEKNENYSIYNCIFDM